MTLLKVEILKDHAQPISRPRKDTNELSWSQIGFAHLGGVFPVEIKIPLQSGTHANPIGVYTVANSSFKVNQYGGLELNRWEITLVPENTKNHQS
jgi:hypothetical protein